MQSNLLNEFDNFIGTRYRTAASWINVIPFDSYVDKPLTYLEIGDFYGANILSVANRYCQHKDTKLYCIDPWTDYADYDEYKQQQPTIYSAFLHNISYNQHVSKITPVRGYSNMEIHKFPNEHFDIIYIDGNHDALYVLEDAVLSFRKLKIGGLLIFDDYGWNGPNMTQRGVDSFITGYNNNINVLGIMNSQVFIKKIK